MSSNKKVRIAVIDSGIDTTASGIDKYVLKSTGFEVNEEGYITESPGKKVDSLHGTVISLIISKICSNVEFISVNILDEKLTTDGRILLHAMSRVLDYEPDIIHMSLGTAKFRYKRYVKKVVREADRNCVTLVASTDNSGLITYPAHVRGVIGVKAGSFNDPMKYGYKNDFFYAPDSVDKMLGFGGKEVGAVKGTSISAAYITGHIANIKIENPMLTTMEVKDQLIKKSMDSKEW